MPQKNPGVLGSVYVTQQTVTAASGAATKAGELVRVTSESLTTAAGGTYTLTLTNSRVKAGSTCLATMQFGTSTTGRPAITTVTPAAGSVVVVIQNIHATAAFNGTLTIDVLTLNPSE